MLRKCSDDMEDKTEQQKTNELLTQILAELKRLVPAEEPPTAFEKKVGTLMFASVTDDPAIHIPIKVAIKDTLVRNVLLRSYRGNYGNDLLVIDVLRMSVKNLHFTKNFGVTSFDKLRTELLNCGFDKYVTNNHWLRAGE